MIVQMWERINNFFVKKIWDIDLASLSRFKTFLIKTLRLIYVGIREFLKGQLTHRAMSLVFTTLLSIVPLLAVSFSVLKAFGVHNQIEPFLHNFLAPLGPKGGEVTQKILEFIRNMKVGILGSIGLTLLIYTVISLIHKVEIAFNYIWKIKRPRSFARRFSDYLSVLLVGPVLIFSALSLTASLMSTTVVQKILSIEPLGTVFYFTGKIIPYIFVCAAFTFIYIFIPSTKVKIRSALTGGIFAGILWETTGWVFSSFIASSTKYPAIYSGFAILILFMIWVYLNWLIVLVGAKVSFYHQYPQALSIKGGVLLLSNRLKEKLSILIMFLIGYNFYHNKSPWNLDSLVERLELPIEPVQNVLCTLQRRGLIMETGDDPPSYLPSKDIETISLKEILDSVRAPEEDSRAIEEKFISTAEVDKIIKTMDESIAEALKNKTIKSLIISNKK